ASMAIGAAVAGADTGTIDTVRDAGIKAGLAFQITDDILDIEGDEDLTGKGLRKDGKKGKITWPGCFGLEESRSKARVLIEESISIVRSVGDDGMIESILRTITDRVS
ncbi:MAG TPA: polyprenyl synthetase family protein, partial [Candidatus Krumholzibacterium sp.]|nr:polyprenyl synthetase family protein [Candidatus Krumholzibacterium sp.]